jgi:NAD(P)-dependent dehydrogenase (short-subunit alcohol dehydrogenase family)
MLDEEHKSIHQSKRTALITAGASGIGKAIAERMMKQGFNVHICDLDDAAIERFLAQYPDAGASKTDVSNATQVDELFSELKARYGRLDLLVNNAGVAGPTARIEDISIEDWDRTVGVNLNGAFYVSRGAVPLLKKSADASIINIASSAALFGFPLRSPYAAAKWGLIGFTKTLAMELGPDGIRVNAICPGSVSGPRLDRVMERDAEQRGISIEETRRIWTQQTSLRCFVDAEDIAAMAAYLVSPEGARISGQSLSVDGHTESLSSPLD